MTFTDEQQRKLAVAQEILGYRFADEQLLLSAITHPSATEGKSVKYASSSWATAFWAPSWPPSRSIGSMIWTKAA